MKRNKALRIAAIALVMVLITTCGMVGTLAKYTLTSPASSASVRAGIFKVLIGTKDIGETFTINLGTKLYDGGFTNAEAFADAKSYNNAGSDNNTGNDIIVPGTMIALDGLTITNLSEVGVKISVDMSSLLSSPFVDSLRIGTDASNKASFMKFSDFATAVTAGTVSLFGTAPNADILAPQTGTATLSGLYIWWPYDKVASSGVDDTDDTITDSDDGADTTVGKNEALIHDNFVGPNTLDPDGDGTTDMLPEVGHGFTNPKPDMNKAVDKITVSLSITATQVD